MFAAACVIAVNVRQDMRRDAAPGDLLDDLLAVLFEPRVDEDVANEVGVDEVARGQRDLPDVFSELLHPANPITARALVRRAT